MGNQFSDHDSMSLYLWQGILGPLNGEYILDSTFSSCGFIICYLVAPTVQLKSLHWPFISIFSIQFQHVISWSLHPVSSISTSRLDYYTCFCDCLLMFYFSFSLSYILSTFQVLTHRRTTSSRDVGSGSQHADYA